MFMLESCHIYEKTRSPQGTPRHHGTRDREGERGREREREGERDGGRLAFPLPLSFPSPTAPSRHAGAVSPAVGHAPRSSLACSQKISSSTASSGRSLQQLSRRRLRAEAAMAFRWTPRRAQLTPSPRGSHCRARPISSLWREHRSIVPKLRLRDRASLQLVSHQSESVRAPTTHPSMRTCQRLVT